MKTKQIAFVGIFSALAFAVMFLEIPIFPAAPFLKYDPSEVFALITALFMNVKTGAIVIIVKNVLFYFAKSGDIVGIIMSTIAGVVFVSIAAAIWKKRKIIAAGFVSTIVVTCVMVAANAIVVPFYFKAPFSLFVKFLPWIVLFNIVKFASNFVLACFVHRYLEKVFRYS